jgi:hypothetical protein
MARRPRMVELKSSVTGLIEEGLSELQSLGEEMRSWHDGMPENFQNGDKGSQVDEAASTLENLATEVDVPEEGDVEVTMTHRPLGRKQSRSSRRDHAVAMLSAAKDKLEELRDGQDEADPDDQGVDEVDYASAIEELENIISEAEAVEFPGMYG